MVYALGDPEGFGGTLVVLGKSGERVGNELGLEVWLDIGVFEPGCPVF